MRKLNLGKILNKTIILIVTLGLLFSMSVSAAVTLDADVTKDNATLTVSCGEAFAGKNIVVQVFEPTGTVEDLEGSGEYDETNADTIGETLACVYHGKLDANGEVSFTVAPTGPKGVYGVRISVKSIYEVTETEFVFSSEDDAQQIIDNLAADFDVEAVAKVLYKDTEASDRVYQPYQILELMESDYYSEYDANGALKASIHNNIVANFDIDSDSTPADFLNAFEDAVVVENVNAKTGDELGEYIANNDVKLGLTARNEYTNIYKNPERFTSEDKAALLDTIEDTPFTGKTPKDFADKFCEEILVNILPGEEEAPGVVDEFILEFDTTLEANGADMAAYKEAEKPLDLCTDIIALAPFETIKDFTDAINAALSEADSDEEEEEDEKPSKPEGNKTGVSVSGGFGGGSSASIPVAKPEEVKPIFTDVASSHWANEAIVTLKDKGIVAGRGDGSFAPNDKVTREEFVKMLSVAIGLDPNSAESQNFADMTGDEWFASYVYAACANGIVKGIDGGFGVGENITRQDMAVLCARAISFKGVTLEAAREGMAFTDAISDYAQEAVSALWGAGIVNGVSETEFAPLATASRAEAAKMLFEVLKALN